MAVALAVVLDALIDILIDRALARFDALVEPAEIVRVAVDIRPVASTTLRRTVY
jgi:hypothetical protein